MSSQPSNLERLRNGLSPASINSYYRCPRKFQFRYIRNVRMPYVFKPALAIGLVTHNAIADYFRLWGEGRRPQSVEPLVETRLKTAWYPNDDVRIEHLPTIIDHSNRAIDALPPEAVIEQVEHTYTYMYSDGMLAEHIEIRARVDLVVRHGDGFVDHIDFKTGQQTGDLFQNFLSRVTVKAHFADMPSEKLRTVNILTRTGAYEVVPSDRDVHSATWETVKHTIRDLARDNQWQARPEPAVCRFCDFHTICDRAELGAENESWSGD
jgi:CRISPR/Cas system-associated exonuclease Cas4 (RecB family)